VSRVRGSSGGAPSARFARARAITAQTRALRRLTVGAACAVALAALLLAVAAAQTGAAIGVATAAGLLLVASEWTLARRRARRDALVARVGALAVSGQTLGRVLDSILAEMAREGLRGASIALVNDNAELYIAAAEGELSQEVRDLRLPVGSGIMGRVALTGRPALVGDLDRPDGAIAAANRNVGSNARIRSIVAVPIRLDGDAFGVLEVDSRVPHRFSPEDMTLLSGIAMAISGAVLNAGPLRLANEELRRRVHELTRLQQAARALNASLDVDRVISEVLGSAAQGLAAPMAALVQRDGAGLRVTALLDGAERSATEGVHVRPAAAGTLDAAVDAAGPVDVDADALTALPELAPLVAARGLRVALCAPLRWPGPQADALLIAASPADRRFDAAERGLLEGIAHLASLAIGNAERFRSLAEMASTDALTGLANVQAFERELAAPHPEGLTVIAVDVDRLKEVNDVAGHEAGDQTLRSVAATLRAAVDGAGFTGRTGGDDFGVILDGANAELAADLAERIRLSMHGVPVPHGVARVSIGVAAEPDVTDARQVWWSAAEAAGTAKVWGGDGVILAEGAAQPSTLKRRWDRVLTAILDGGGITSVYQPVIRLRDLGLIGYEALARPTDAREGGVEGLFAAAQRSGRARDLDWMCRRAALEGAAQLPDSTVLFVNVGVWALLDPLHPVDQMLLLMEWTGRPPSGVVLELTERDLISDLPRLVDVLAEYREQGFRFAIDDLGEGHSTLEVLSRAAPEYVKLASSLTTGRGNRGVEAAIAAVVTFAEHSGATIIAEGIETGDDADFMLEMGVELGQGWFLGRPGALPGQPRAPEGGRRSAGPNHGAGGGSPGVTAFRAS
jgi:diguanylate cyclase (GGDEF)-like protein